MATDTLVSRSIEVMTLVELAGDSDKVTFASAHDDTLEIYRTLSLTRAHWQDLGAPAQLTITIVPGDTLNT